MTALLIVVVALAVSLIVAAFVPPPTPPPSVLFVLPPRTWGEFLQSPLPWVADDVPLRNGNRQDELAKVFNHAAALARFGYGRT